MRPPPLDVDFEADREGPTAEFLFRLHEARAPPSSPTVGSVVGDAPLLAETRVGSVYATSAARVVKVSRLRRYLRAMSIRGAREMGAALHLLRHHDHREVGVLRALPQFPLFGRICWALRAADENGQSTVVSCSPRLPAGPRRLTPAQCGQAVYALLYLNRLGFCHGDPAPRNVLLSETLRAPRRIEGIPSLRFTVPAGERHAVLIDFNQATRRAKDEAPGTDAEEFLRNLEHAAVQGRDVVEVLPGETPLAFLRRTVNVEP